MPSLNSNKKAKCENYGTQTTKLNLARHKKRCVVGNLYSTQWPIFSTNPQNDLNYPIVRKVNAPKTYASFKCNFRYQEFPGFYALRQLKRTKHWIPINTANVEPYKILTYFDDANLKDQFNTFP